MQFIAATLLCMTSAVGCAGGRTPGYARDYNAGRFSTAFREATAVAAVQTGAEREEAALIAGLAAHALGDTAHATEWLTPLLASRERTIAGRAAAGLGLIAQGRGDFERAAALLSEAALKLSGDDAAQAAFRAGDAYLELGQTEAARQQFQYAYSQAKDSDLKRALTERLNDHRYTIQLGAFASRRNAERAVREFAAMTMGLGLGTPRVVQTAEHGRTLFLVQAGEFRSQSEADQMKQRLGVSAIVAGVSDR